jgi:hypothetical protein
MAKVRDYTLVDPVRCYMIHQLGKQAFSIEGDIAEVGDYKGGTARLLASVFRESRKEIYFFDTFQGMPLTNPEKSSITKEIITIRRWNKLLPISLNLRTFTCTKTYFSKLPMRYGQNRFPLFILMSMCTRQCIAAQNFFIREWRKAES